MVPQWVKDLAEITALVVGSVLFTAAYVVVGYFFAGFAHALGVSDFWREFGLILWIAAGLTAYVLWLGWHTETIEFRPHRRPVVDVGSATVEWSPVEVTSFSAMSGNLVLFGGAR